MADVEIASGGQRCEVIISVGLRRGLWDLLGDVLKHDMREILSYSNKRCTIAHKQNFKPTRTAHRPKPRILPRDRDIDQWRIGLVSPGAATDGVALSFLCKKLATFLVIATNL